MKAENGGTEDGLWQGIAMFHLLHCLISIRGLMFKENTNVEDSASSPHQTGDEKQDMDLWAHCFDYIAQFCSFPFPIPLSK
ncbi:hypothetical protein BDV12DRAFT_162604 [Aspergillus spectabilis]